MLQILNKSIDFNLIICYINNVSKRKADKMMNLNLKTSKEQALREYKEAKANLMATFNGKKFDDEMFRIFSNAKRNCMLLGIIL